MKVGFVGMGNMAKALVSGIQKSGLVEEILAYAPTYDKLCKNAEKYGFKPYQDANEMIKCSDIVVIAFKPYHVEKMIPQLRESLKDKAVISVVAGWSFDRYSKLIDESTRFQYLMPNTPAMVGEGVFLMERKNSFRSDERALIMELFSNAGLVMEIESDKMDIANAICGCGPAFISMVIEALGDAGVKYGLSRQDSYMLASKMVMGTGRLQYETGEHPGTLKDNVCSPGGITIRGVDALEHAGLRSAFIDAVDAVMAFTH